MTNGDKMRVMFKNEIDLIKNNEIKEVVRKCLLHAPDYFWTMPASTSGQWHPSYCLGEGGLIRHIKATVAIAVALFRLEQYSDLPRDEIIAALILHDIVKKDPLENRTAFLHPLWGAEFVAKYGGAAANNISKLILSHMGQWNTNEGQQDLPKPSTKAEFFVHLCDYLASRKFIEIKFEA